MFLSSALSDLDILLLTEIPQIRQVSLWLRCQFFSLANDRKEDYVELVAWSVVEPMLGIVCACLPSMRQLLGHVLPKGFGFASSAKKSSAGIGDKHSANRIYQSRSFKIESKLRSQTDEFHELSSRSNVAGSETSAGYHTPGNLNNKSKADNQDPDLCGPEDEERGIHVWERDNQSTHESIDPLRTKL